LTLISDLFEIRSRKAFSANDITVWLVEALRVLFGIKVTQIQTEVIIRGRSRGRADLVVQDSVGIETKRDLEEELADAEAQVGRILEKLEKEGDISPVGIATDGQSWRFYVLAEGKPFGFFSFSLKGGSEDRELENSLWIGLTTFRHQKDRPDPTAEAIAEVFRPSGPAFNEARTQLIAKIRYLAVNEPIEFTSKFLPWFELFSFVYNNFQARCRRWADYGTDLPAIVKKLQKLTQIEQLDESTLKGGIELFVRHTYLALLAKILSSLVTLGEEGVAKSLLSDPASLITGTAIQDAGFILQMTMIFLCGQQRAQTPGS